MDNLSRAISFLFHPLLMATYATALFLFILPSPYAFPDVRVPYFIVGLVATGTFFLPVLSSFMMLRLGKIESLQMETQGERNWPLVQTVLIYFGVLYAVHSKIIPPFIQIFILGATASLIVAIMINLKWKISLHMIGIGGFCGAIAGTMISGLDAPPKILASSFILAGVVGSARHNLGAHNLLQILLGFVAGFAIEFCLMMFLMP